MTNKRTRPNGAGSVYKINTGKRAGRWAAAVTFTTVDGQRRRKVLTAPTKSAADALLLRMRAEALQGRVLTTDRQSVATFLNMWLEDVARPSVRETSYEIYRNIVQRHLSPALGRHTLANLTPQLIQQYMNRKRTEGLANTTVRDHLGLLKQALGKAVRWGLISRNPAKQVDAPTPARPRIQVLTKAQGRALVEAVQGDKYEAAFLVMIGMGLRRGETLGLKWEDIDFEAGVMHIRRQLVRMRGEKTLHRVKTDESEATLSIPSFVLQSLLRHHDRQLIYKRACGPLWHEAGLVFTDRYGGLVEPVTVKYRFDQVLLSAGLPHMRLHDLRHSAGTLMLAMGVPQKVVQDILRHSSPLMTDKYLHTLDSMKDEAAKRMDELFG